MALIVGIALICFPIWFAFVASTVTQADIIRPPLPLIPGPHSVRELQPRAVRKGVNAPVSTMLFNSTVMALGITFGKIRISIVSAFAIVYFRFPGRTICFWLIFLT